MTITPSVARVRILDALIISLYMRNVIALAQRHPSPVQRQSDVLKESLTMSQGFDLTDRRDVACLVNVFYDRVRDDGLLGPIFDDVAHVDWATHLPRMYDFWESVLFGTATFKGVPLVVHRDLAGRTPLTPEAFDRWLTLFKSTVDDLFSGVIAEQAKDTATRIAATMSYRLAADDTVR